MDPVIATMIVLITLIVSVSCYKITIFLTNAKNPSTGDCKHVYKKTDTLQKLNNGKHMANIYVLTCTKCGVMSKQEIGV